MHTSSSFATYTWSCDGNRTALSSKIGSTADFSNAYQYDALNRETSVGQGGSGGDDVDNKFVTFGYDLDGETTSINRYHGTSESGSLVAASTYSFDQYGDTTGLTETEADGTTTYTAYSWSYDADREALSFGNSAYASTESIASFGYDSQGDLISATKPSLATASAANSLTDVYDANGNATNINDTGSGSGADQTVGAGNTVLFDGANSYTYDDNGNVTMRWVSSAAESAPTSADTADSDITVYVWDARNRLQTAYSFNYTDYESAVDHSNDYAAYADQTITYRYDNLNNLVSRVVTGTDASSSQYVYDGQNMVLAFAGSSSPTDRYLWGPAVDQVLADEQPGLVGALSGSTSYGTLWTLADNQGTVRDLVDDAGELIEHVAYSPFGQQVGSLTSNPDAVDFVFGYTGTYTDSVTGDQLHGARWYDPTAQRWLSQDPTGLSAGPNPYEYVGNGPTDGTDPSGLGGIDDGPGSSFKAKFKYDLATIYGYRFQISAKLEEVAQKAKVATKSNPQDVTAEMNFLRDYSLRYMRTIIDAQRVIKSGEISNKDIDTFLALSYDVDGFDVYGVAAKADPSLPGELYGTGEAVGETLREKSAALGRLENGLKIADYTITGVGLLAGGVQAVAKKCVVKTAVTVVTVGGAFYAAHWGLEKAGASAQTIAFVDAGAQIAMLFLLHNSGCFVAGTPVFLVGESEDELPPTDGNVESRSDSDGLMAGALLLAGLGGLRLDKKKSKKKDTGDEPQSWLEGEGDTEDDETLSDGIYDVRLRRTSADQTPAAAPAAVPAITPAAEGRDGGLAEARSASRESRRAAKPGIGFRRLWMAGCLVLAAFFAGKSWLLPGGTHSHATAPGAAKHAHQTAAIETIRVGQRVLARNPGSSPAQAAADTAVDPATWRRLTLRAEVRGANGDEDRVEIETLQPREWLATNHASLGALVPIPLDLVEMGLPKDLRAEVVANEACPPIESGPGRVVVTTVSHVSNCVCRMTVENESGRRELVRPTAFHKFYREPGAWVSCVDLRPGDRLRGAHGTLTVVDVSDVRSSERVYNMTVEGEHVYYVSNLGVLAHNTDCVLTGEGAAGEGAAAAGESGAAARPAATPEPVATDTGNPHAPGDVPNQYSVVKGGTGAPPEPGTVYSGSQGRTLPEASAGVPHGQVQSTTSGAIRNAGGTVTVNPEFNPKVGQTNYQHVDVVDGPSGSPLSPPQPNPVPKPQRFGGPDYNYGR